MFERGFQHRIVFSPVPGGGSPRPRAFADITGNLRQRVAHCFHEELL